jgi:hypothetical protein
VDPKYAILVTAGLAVLRGILLAAAWVIALRAKSPARRKVALELTALILTPYWRRGAGGSYSPGILPAKSADTGRR